MKKKPESLILFMCMALVLGACSSPFSNGGNEKSYEDTGFMPATPGNYDSLDTAVYVD